MERIGIGIVGLNFGTYIVEHELLQGPGRDRFALRAVCDLDAGRAEQAAGRYGVRAYNALDTLLDAPDVQVVGLFTPPNGRAGLIRRILRAGKDVMTTKPFERDPAAARAVLDEAARLGRVVHLNSPGPVFPEPLRAVHAWQATHSLGRPVAARWETWISYREQADGSWYDDPARCPVAPLYRLGIYAVNDLVQVFDGHPAEAVQVLHSRLFTGRPTPDNAMMTVRFAGGILASVFASFCIDDGLRYPDALTLSFENGTVYRRDLPYTVYDAAEVELTLVMNDGGTARTVERITFPKPHGARYQWDALYQAVRGEPVTIDTTTDHIVAGLSIIDALARAADSGRTEPVHPA